MNEEKLKEELANYNKALQINPKDTSTYYSRGKVLRKLGRLEEALADYDKILEINPKNFCAYYIKGMLLSKLGRLEESLASYDKALEINPNHADTYCFKGCILQSMQRPGEALENFNKAIEINPKDDTNYCFIGNVLESLGKIKEALANYERALEINPKDPVTYCIKGNLLIKLERLEDALTNFNKAIEINPKDDDTYYFRGNVLNRMGRPEDALASYNKALEINPKNSIALNNKGYILSDLGKKEEALTCYIQAIQINPDSERIKHNRRCLIGSQEFWNSLHKNSQVDLWSGDEDFNTLASSEKLKDCPRRDLQGIHHLWVEQYRLLHLLRADLKQVGHYTSTAVFETLLQELKGKVNPLLLCSLAAANDPTEGAVFQSLLGEDCMPFQKIHSNLAVLQTSFSSSIDSLNQFRLYGKNNGEEGTGLCLVFNQSFFAGPGETSMINVKRDHKQSSEEKVVTCRKQPLYWVLYYDRHSGHVYYTPACTEYSLNQEFEMTATSVKESDLKKVEDIGKSLKRIRDHFKAISKEYQQTALEMLIYLRHLVKDAAFKGEKELRILSLHPYHDQGSSLKVLPGKNCLSVDYLPVIHEGEEYLEKVIAGPKLRDFANLVDVAKFRLHHLGGRKKVEFCQSQAPLS